VVTLGVADAGNGGPWEWGTGIDPAAIEQGFNKYDHHWCHLRRLVRLWLEIRHRCASRRFVEEVEDGTGIDPLRIREVEVVSY